MTISEILKELESISYQLDSTSSGFVENDSDLSGAKNDLNYVLDTLEKQLNIKLEDIQIDGC